MARLPQLHDNIDRTKYFTLQRENILGRGPEATIPYENRRVSRRHARICAAPSGQAFWIEDISARGVYVNFRRIQGRFPLKEGDRICILQFRNIHPLDLERMSEEELKDCCDDTRNDGVEAIVDLTFGYGDVEEQARQGAPEPEGLLAKLKALFARK